MKLRSIQFLSMFFTALSLGPALAHLLELPNKMKLARAAYLTVQQIYRGWALLGIVIIAAIITTLMLVLLVRKYRVAFAAALVALICLAGSQAVFWFFTFPANRATANWTFLPDSWIELRQQWEFSHAAGAVLTLIAFSALIVSMLKVPVETPEPRVGVGVMGHA